MQIEHIIFLIHPCCYEPLSPEAIHRNNQRLFLEREREVKRRWLAELAALPANTLVFQLGGPTDLRDQAVEYLGESLVFYPDTRFPENGDLAEYYCRLTDDFNDHCSAHGLSFESATVKSELWGESFEGCVPGYGGAFAQYLGLQRSPKMRFEMTVYDSRFLHTAKDWITIPLPGSDVEAWLFTCSDGTGAAMFQARRTAQWLDKRRVHLLLDNRRMQVCNKRGHTLWPDTPWEKGKSEMIVPYEMTLKDCNWRWIRAVATPIDAFRDVIRATRVTVATKKDGSP